MPEFHENWFKERHCLALASFVAQVEDVPGRIVEIGSWEGRSTIALANSTAREVNAVDTWKGSPSDQSSALAAERDVFTTFLSNIAEATSGNVVAHRMDWRRYRQCDESPIALLFIDAEHTYDEVSKQLTAFLPLMSPGGIVCGDDFDATGVATAVMQHVPTAKGIHRMWWAYA